MKVDPCRGTVEASWGLPKSKRIVSLHKTWHSLSLYVVCIILLLIALVQLVHSTENTELRPCFDCNSMQCKSLLLRGTFTGAGKPSTTPVLCTKGKNNSRMHQTLCNINIFILQATPMLHKLARIRFQSPPLAAAAPVLFDSPTDSICACLVFLFVCWMVLWMAECGRSAVPQIDCISAKIYKFNRWCR